MAKRGRLEIMRDTLKIIRDNKNSIRITPLLRKSNISSARFRKYYSEFLAKNFVKEINHKGEKSISLTEKGFRFLDKYKAIINFIEEFEL
jgi:predicted transcriptional regulator